MKQCCRTSRPSVNDWFLLFVADFVNFFGALSGATLSRVSVVPCEVAAGVATLVLVLGLGSVMSLRMA